MLKQRERERERENIYIFPPGRQHFFAEIDHEIFSTVILSLPLVQEGQLLVSGERMCTILVNRLICKPAQ